MKLLLLVLSLLPHDNIHFSAIVHGLRHGIDPALVLAVIQIENAKHDLFVVNHGCYGLMQISYKTWKVALNLQRKRLFEIDYNIEQGVKVLRHYLDKEHGNVEMALFRYNNGYKHNNRKYAPRVKAVYARIKYCSGPTTGMHETMIKEALK